MDRMILNVIQLVIGIIIVICGLVYINVVGDSLSGIVCLLGGAIFAHLATMDMGLIVIREHLERIEKELK